jgi:ATP-dependent Lon protease
VIPKRNEKDLVDVPDDVKESLGIHLVDTIDEALALTLGAASSTSTATTPTTPTTPTSA